MASNGIILEIHFHHKKIYSFARKVTNAVKLIRSHYLKYRQDFRDIAKKKTFELRVISYTSECK